MITPAPPGRDLAATAALTALAAALRLWALAGPEPPGTDGYYYVVQAEHLARAGTLHVPDASWTLRVLAVPHRLGMDPIAGHAVAAALLAASVVPAAALLGRRASPAAGLALAAWAAVSPTIGQLAADFPKSLGAVPALYLAGALLGRTAPGAAAAALLAAAAHRTGAAAVALGAVGALAAGVRPSPRALAAAVGAALGFAAASAALPGLLHPADLERVAGQLRAVPWPPAPWCWVPLRAIPPLQLAELAAPWVALGAGAAALREPEARLAVAPWLAPLAVALFPFWRADALDLGYRLSLLAPVVAAPILARRARTWAAPLLLAAAPWSGVGAAAVPRPPYDTMRAWIARIPRPLPELLIVEPGASFLYDHLTGASALAWAPEPGLDRARIWRVATDVRDGEWAAWAPPDPPVVRLDRRRVLVREDVWEAFVARAAAEGDDDVRARLADPRNPSTVRPAGLVRNRGPAPAPPLLPPGEEGPGEEGWGGPAGPGNPRKDRD